MKKIAQYILFAGFGVFLLYFTFRDLELKEVVDTMGEVKFRWIFLAAIAHLMNHFLRAFRWRMLVEVQGYSILQGHAFVAEMSGFFLNLIPARAGDWLRCVILKRLEGVRVSKSFGGVVVERFIDMFLFLCLCVIVFLIAFFTDDKILSSLMPSMPTMDKLGSSPWIMSAMVVLLVSLSLVMYRRYQELVAAFWWKVKQFSKEVLIAIRCTRKCNPWVLSATSLFILFFHFMVEYLSIYAIEQMLHIDLKGALYVFIAINVGMAAPTPGGIGAYHLGVITILTALGVEPRYAAVYATLTHLIQLFNALVVGGICFLVSTFLASKQAKVRTTKPSNMR